MISYPKALLIVVPVAAVLFVSIAPAFAQQAGNTFYPRIEIWALFYRLMVVAFVIGAVIMGVMFYTVWRFRESNPRNKNLPTRSQGSHEH
jgi:heme/copper-type cytochrome/quinol oxidase subunit 2